MRNQHTWKPSKYRISKGRLRASTDKSEVGSGSRLVVECIAAFYDKAIATHARGKLIDLGCGKAPLFIKYRDFVSDVTCVDWGNTIHKNENLDFQCDLSRELPFKDESYDTVILSDVLEHLPEPDLLWGELARIMKPGAHVLINTPYFYPLHEMPYDFYRYSCYALRRFAERHGFEVLELEALGGSPEVLADILGKHMQFVPLLGPPLAILIQALTLAVVRTPLGQRISRKSSERFPLAYGLVARKTPSGGAAPN